MGGATSSGTILLVALGACAGCASPNRVDEEPLISRQDVDVPPRVRRCGAGYARPASRSGDPELTVRVTVPVVVGADGRVESIGTPQIVRNPADSQNLRLSASARDQARYMAEGCIFEPALLQGVPVSSRFDLTFTIPA